MLPILKTGFFGPVPGYVDPGSGFADVWERPDLMVAIQAAIVGFSTANIDTTITAPTRSAGTVFIDPTVSTDGSGSFASPRKASAFGYTFAANTEYRLKGGTVWNAANATNNAIFRFSGANTTLCSYDPATGARLAGQPNAKQRALAGQWYTETERTTEYAQIDMGWAPPKNSGDSSYPACLALTSGNTGVVVSGIEFRNWGLAAVACNNGASVRVEDCIFGMTNHDTRVDNAAYGGGVLRCDAATAGTFDVVRCFGRTGTMDFFWGGSNSTTVPVRFIDNAIIHNMSGIWHGNAHADLFQAQYVQDQKLVRGNVFQHTSHNTVNYNSSGPIQGRAFINNAAGALTSAVTAGGGGMVWEQNILVSNVGGGYWTGSPATVNNCGFIMLPNQTGVTLSTGGASPMLSNLTTHGWGGEGGDQSHAIFTETDCVHWLMGTFQRMTAGYQGGGSTANGRYVPVRVVETYVT